MSECSECARLEKVALDQQDKMKRLEVESDRLRVADKERGKTNATLNKRNGELESALRALRTQLVARHPNWPDVHDLSVVILRADGLLT